jgi:flagellar motor switch protein FliG
MNDEYTFIEEDELEDPKEHEVPEIEKNSTLNIKKASELKNLKTLKSKVNKKILPLLEEMENINNEVLWELEEILESIIDRKGSFQESHEDALDTLADVIAYHKLIIKNIETIRSLTK